MSANGFNSNPSDPPSPGQCAEVRIVWPFDTRASDTRGACGDVRRDKYGGRWQSTHRFSRFPIYTRTRTTNKEVTDLPEAHASFG